MARVVVIGAGLGGLTAAALLRQAGHGVTVLEAHVYPGGSAGTFFHQGYRFDAGATLAGGFGPGGPHTRVAEALGLEWPVIPADPAWVVQLPDRRVVQWSGREAWAEERAKAFPGSEPFWRRQESLSKAAWDVAGRPFPWPPQSPRDLVALAQALRPATLVAAPYLTRTIANLAQADGALATFLDAQLLISAQTTAGRANALYGSAALDLPRRGVNHVTGGMGALATVLASWLRANGADVHFRQEVEAIETSGRRAVAVRTRRGLRLEADAVVANVTPWGLARLLESAPPPAIRRELTRRQPTWGAFTLYLGLDAAGFDSSGDHFQVVRDPARPLGEGNSVFISLSPASDGSRAPAGHRVATLSTHTAVAPWWAARSASAEAYETLKANYTERLLAAAETVLPGLRRAVRVCLPGTPVTFERFTRRPMGMVGGFAQTSLFSARGPATGLVNTWLVGDSVFPGQSSAGVTVGAMRVANAVEHALRDSSARLHPKSRRLSARRPAAASTLAESR